MKFLIHFNVYTWLNISLSLQYKKQCRMTPSVWSQKLSNQSKLTQLTEKICYAQAKLALPWALEQGVYAAKRTIAKWDEGVLQPNLYLRRAFCKQNVCYFLANTEILGKCTQPIKWKKFNMLTGLTYMYVHIMNVLLSIFTCDTTVLLAGWHELSNW